MLNIKSESIGKLSAHQISEESLAGVLRPESLILSIPGSLRLAHLYHLCHRHRDLFLYALLLGLLGGPLLSCAFVDSLLELDGLLRVGHQILRCRVLGQLVVQLGRVGLADL